MPISVETLADRIAREGPLSELDAVGWAVRLAKRIESMHALGVTHGSVSPQCVLVEGRDRTARASLVDVRRTPSSVAYHSPERLAGGGLSQADDTWALACTLYAALTGGPPFTGANDAEVKQKIANSAPAPLAVFDVGDDDLQRVLDDAFARDLAHRTATVGALRRALEEWHPDPNVAALPGLEDEDTEGGSEGDDEDEDERTIMRPAPILFGRPAPAAEKPAGPVAEGSSGVRVAPPRASAPGAVPPPRASAPGAVPPPRASAPGAIPAARGSSAAAVPGAVPPPRASAPGAALSPLAAARSGPAARAVPPARASGPGVVQGGARSPLPAPTAASLTGSPAGVAPPPEAPPPEADTTPPGADEDEDERTIMRAVPESLAAIVAARPADPSRSGAFAAVPPSKSGAFPAHVAAPAEPAADDDADADEPEDEEEATRMMPSPAALMMPGAPRPAAGRASDEDADDDDDDDDQKTLMRTSLTDDEVARPRGPSPAAGAAPAPRPAAGSAPAAPEAEPGAGDEEAPLAGTMTLDALNLAHAPGSLDAAPGSPEAAPGGAFVAAPAAPEAPALGSASAPGFAAAAPGAAPLAAAGTGAAAAPSPPRKSSAVWLFLVLVVLVAGGVLAALRFLT